MRKLRISIAIVAALAVIFGVWAATASADPGQRYATATASKGSVRQDYLTAGTVSRVDTVENTFAVSGTVAAVPVRIGDHVEAGDVLAELDSAELKLAVLNAESDLADAEASLYSAEHPATGTSGRMPNINLADLGGGGGGTQPPSALNPSVDDLQQLYTAIAEVTRTAVAWSTVDNPDAEPTLCDTIYAALTVDPQTPDPEPTDPADPDPSTDPGGDPGSDDDSGSNNTPEPSPSPTPADPQPTPTEEATPTAEPTAEAPASEPDEESAVALSVTAQDITLEQLQTCGETRKAVVMANAVLADYYNQLMTTGTIEGSVNPDQPDTGTGAKLPSGNASSGSGSASTSAAQIAQAEVGVLQAQQRLDEAEADLDKATLKASVSGTVGALTLTTGGSASGSVTIVGAGAAEIAFELPLSVRQLVEVGDEVSASPAGSTLALDGIITSISQLETSGTAGDNPSYTAVALVDDPDQRLADGAAASVQLAVRTADDAVTVPSSAVTVTGPGEGVVSIVETADQELRVSSSPVQLGASGGGKVEITSGLAEGDVVVIADANEPLPSN
ncbi:MAG: biotin/lipoyl-binding protein [Propionibacteriaceae bacterium]|jgi:multidrug efflux pump subunit AcrA (membrane-fusion protein)|nr:biotin/lipoyl-binding protein [Propionibacteriaceae bacterium]